MKNSVKIFWGVASGLLLTTFAFLETSDLKWTQNFLLSKNEQLIQQNVDSCNAITSTLPYEMFQKGPPVAREVLGVQNDATKSDMINIIKERSKGAYTAKQQALAVLQLPWYTPEPILRKRIMLLDRTIVAMHSLDETVNPHGRNYGYTYFQWFPHDNPVN
jgi:hypothetical protein